MNAPRKALDPVSVRRPLAEEAAAAGTTAVLPASLFIRCGRPEHPDTVSIFCHIPRLTSWLSCCTNPAVLRG
jgi:hypothetical protein